MDTPTEEQQIFQKVTCKLAASEDEITEPNMLSIGHINYVSQMPHCYIWLGLYRQKKWYTRVVVSNSTFNFPGRGRSFSLGRVERKQDEGTCSEEEG